MNPGSSAEQVNTPLMSGEDLYNLGNMQRAELIQGKIKIMSPTGFLDGDIELTIGSLIRDFVSRNQLGRVMTGEVGIYTSRNPDTVRGADVVYISHQRLQQVQTKSFLDVAPELIVEVLSPGDRWVDVNSKLEEYFSIGIDRVWIINPRARSVQAYFSLTGITILHEADIVKDEELLPGFECNVREFFS